MRYIGGFLIVLIAAACERDTPIAVPAPVLDLPVEEPVHLPERVTAREAPPPEAG